MDQSAKDPLLKLNFLSHGTLLLDDMAATRRFYEEFLGLEVVRTSTISFAIRLNSETSVACVALSKQVRRGGREYLRHYNFGLTVDTPDDVADARALALEHKESYAMRGIGDLEETDGGASFLIQDLDGNYWQILNEPVLQ